MVIIFNAIDNGLTEEQMKMLYRKDLIVCNDFTLTVATIPSWAIDEVKSVTGKKYIKGTLLDVSDDPRVPKNKEAVAAKNRYDYPKLYNEIMI